MTEQETAKILAYFREAFPSGSQVSEARVRLWHDLIQEYDFEIAWVAAKNVVRTWQGYTMPTPAALIQEIERLFYPEDTAIELWRIAEKAIKRGSILTQAEFNELPEPVQRYFGDLSAIRDLSQLNIEQLPNERARFLRLIESIYSQMHDARRFPESIRDKIETREEK